MDAVTSSMPLVSAVVVTFILRSLSAIVALLRHFDEVFAQAFHSFIRFLGVRDQ
jgi:hypothetical protein